MEQQLEQQTAEYKAEYDKAAAELEAAEKSTTPRDDQGRFAKVETPVVETPVAPETPEVDPIAELTARLEKAEKIAEDNKAWGTRNAQELAALKREREQQARDAQRPKILDANPDLAEAIRFVASDPAPKAEQGRNEWAEVVQAAHPGIFDLNIDPDLYKALLSKREALGATWDDPLVAIREITNEKLAHAERQIGKRFAAETAKLAQKSAMSVPGAGGSAVNAVPSPQDEVNRIRNMSEAEFAREVRKVQGY